MQTRQSWVAGRKGISFWDDAGNLWAFLEEGGLIGLGTATPGEKLHVAGDIRIGDPAASTAASYEINMPNGSGTINGGNGRELFITAGSSDNFAGRRGGHLYLRGGPPTSPATAYGNVILADLGGRVGVGTGNPTLGLMQFEGTLGGAGEAGLYINPATAGGGTQYGARVVANGAGATNFIGLGIHGGTLTNWKASLWIGNEANRPGLSIGYAASDLAPTHGAIVAGNVGIGNNSPRVPLDVGNSADVPIQTLSEILILAERAGRARVVARNTTDDVEAMLIAGTTAANFGTASNHPLILATNNAEVARLTANGNLGINTPDQFGSGVGVVGIKKATTNPSTNPTDTVVVYGDSSDGSGKARTPSGNVATFAPNSPPSVTGSRGGNAALASLLTALAGLGLIVNNTTA